MGRIRILSDVVANKIAAGEVVERPASVVKEMLENSLDAGATRIRIEVEAGGKKRIQVVDDGCGMVRDDALLAFERHATSKLRDSSDLLSISTLGFRGEALPAIGSVSRLLLETRSSEEIVGTRVEIAGGRMINVQEVGLPVGTSITVSNLFYNIPARRQFLRTESTELSHITSTVTHYALAYPEKAFSLKTPAGELFNVSPSQSLRERVYELFGEELLGDLIEFGPRQEQILPRAPLNDDPELADLPLSPTLLTLHGLLSRPQVQKLNRNSIYVFVNRRLVRDRVMLHAIHQAYRNIIPPNTFPVAMLFLDMPYEEVDVNVHPSKTEVRFRHQSILHDLVRDTLREALTANKPVSTFPVGATWAPEELESLAVSDANHEIEISKEQLETEFIPELPSPLRQPLAGDFSLSQPAVQPSVPTQQRLPQDQPLRIGMDVKGSLDPCGYAPVSDSTTRQSERAVSSPAEELQDLRPLGQISESYVVAASVSGLWLIDQHAAHERVLFEQLLYEREQGKVESQRLLMPLILRLNAAQQSVWTRVAAELTEAGFEAEPFGQGTIAVKAAPAGVKAEDIEKLLNVLMESIEGESQAFSSENVRRKIAASVACHAAIKVNMPLDMLKMEWLLTKLAATRFPMSCPHGRPVVLKYEMKEILKAFHRI